jgi:hypothetical protein
MRGLEETKDMFVRVIFCLALVALPALPASDIGLSYTAIGENIWQVFYKVRNGSIGNIKEIKLERPVSANKFQGEKDIFTVLSPPGWKSSVTSSEESFEDYSISWEVENEAIPGIGPYEELEFSIVTGDKNFLGSQQFFVYCDHIKCNYDGWTQSEGTRTAAIVPKFMNMFNKDYTGSIPVNLKPSPWGITSSSNFYVNFFPLDPRPVPSGTPRTLDGFIGTEYPKTVHSCFFIPSDFDPISRTVTNGIASLDFIASFDFRMNGALDGNGDGTVSDEERLYSRNNFFLVQFKSRQTNQVSLSLKISGEKTYLVQNYATGKQYAGDFPNSFLESTPQNSKFWSSIRIETFRDGSISVAGRASDNNPVVMASIPPSEGQVKSFNSIRFESNRPGSYPYWIDYKFDNINISLKHNEMSVSKLTDMSGNPVQELQAGVKYKLIGAGFQTSTATPELKFGSQACSITSWNDREIVFTCSQNIRGYRNVTLKCGTQVMEGRFYLNKKLRGLIPVMHLLLR